MEEKIRPMRGGIFGYLSSEKLAVLIPFIGLVFLVLGVSSFIAWPYLIRTSGADTEVGAMARGIMISGLIGLGITSLFIILLAAFSEDGYTSRRSVSICSWLCPVVTWIAMAVMRLSPLGNSAGFLSRALNVMVLGIVGLVVSVIPAFIAVMLGWLARILCGLIGKKM